MAQPTIPFPHITSLSKADQERLRRNFDDLYARLVATKVFDVYVNPLLVADSVSALTFRTPFAAIAYAVDTLGLSVVSVGWITDSGSSQTATETANYPGTGTPTWVNVTAIGEDDGSITGRGTTGRPTWALAGNTDNGKIAHLGIVGINITVTTNRTTSPIGAGSMCARACSISGTTGSTTAGWALATGLYLDCSFIQCTFVNDSGGHILQNCTWSAQSLQTISTPQKFFAYNCRFNSAGSATTTWSASGQVFIAADCAFVGDNPTGSRFALTSSAQLCYMTIPMFLGFGFASGTGLRLTISAGSTVNVIVGAMDTITVGSVSQATINVVLTGVFDITGPAAISVNTAVQGNTLRGNGISGNVTIGGANPLGLNLVGVTQSVITAAFRGSGTGKAYAIDAASGTSVMIEDNDLAWGTGSTNASATFLVINHTGSPPSGAASGSLAGAYPNPTFSGRDSSVDQINRDLLPALLVGTSEGVSVIPVPTPGSAPTGPAAGSLAGTYPNPTLAGRDASVDEINKDMLPGLLLP